MVSSIPDWFDWSDPDYESVFLLRAERLKKLRSTPGMLAGLKEHYKNNPVDFINDWGLTLDPRNAEIGQPTTIPFLLFPKQEEFVNWVVDRWRAREDGLGEKSRDMGVTWLCTAIAVWLWLYYAGTVVGFGSRKEEYVDKLSDPKSIFSKIRAFIALLPKELRPKGYDEKSHALFMRIINPENGSAIVGEAGENIGRGNRTSIYFLDEAAFVEKPKMVDAALSQTSNCKIHVSTPNGNGNPFYQKRHSGRIPVFSFSWREDPRKDDAWYQKQRASLDPVILAQEIDIDYNASVNNAWINGDLISQAQSLGPADIHDQTGQWVVGVDAAHFGDDESIIHMRKGRINLPQIAMTKMDGPQLAGRVEEECRTIEATGEYVQAIVIELDGPGVSCFDHLRRDSGPYRSRVVGVHTGRRLKDNVNYNLRALLWRRGRDYLDNPPVSINNEPEFKAQLGSLKFGYKNGLLLMQAKAEYKKEFGRSPDRADAFILTFADADPVDDDDERWYHDHNADSERDAISGY